MTMMMLRMVIVFVMMCLECVHSHCSHILCTMHSYSAGHLIPHKWESGQKIQPKSWGFIRNTDLSGYLNITEILRRLVTTVRCNNNYCYTLHTDVHVYIHTYLL